MTDNVEGFSYLLYGTIKTFVWKEWIYPLCKFHRHPVLQTDFKALVATWAPKN